MFKQEAEDFPFKDHLADIKMSRLYDTVEPSVIDDEMLTKAVHEQGPKGEAGRIAREEGIDFANVQSLRLDFKNILKIDNFWCFTSLTKLQLDNNIIERIEGLDHLVNLRWLDLSFNNIEVIEGLDTLTKLEDLTLFNNRISKIENISNLKQLQVFSIGNNNLQDLENLLVLRRFLKLQTMNLKGNPFCEKEDYLPYIFAFLPQLVFLDYKLIDSAARSQAHDRYQIRVEELMADEAAEDRKTAALQSESEKLTYHTKAYVENLNGSQLFDAMYEEDSEGQKLNELPGIDEALEQYKEKFTAACIQLFEFGLEEHKKRENEVEQFWECIEEAKNDNTRLSTAAIQSFTEYKLKTMSFVSELTDNAEIERATKVYKEEVYVLRNKLMAYELQLVDQLEEAIKEFERNLSDMVANFLENVQAYMAQCRDLENQHNERLMELAIVILEKVLKNELEEDISEELRANPIFVDKDTVMNAVQSSHDLHLLKIDNREDEITTRIKAWMNNLLTSIHNEEEIQRNRSRVSEIAHLIDNFREEIDNLELPGI